ncbi:hypothetical protein [Nitratidesulfovibrio liaohensis]|uniref:hypothetical protein n=1 Tax=Nitratidesulfovibrio liaohensis TaxID=2604158 RepID=UPI0014207AEB|nr:hypothetical protein [Nitratidesulfovibrio liaohensis]NHZ48199.1 hypothetical protein [Nitratidesulfovibrio liaohensis]
MSSSPTSTMPRKKTPRAYGHFDLAIDDALRIGKYMLADDVAVPVRNVEGDDEVPGGADAGRLVNDLKGQG